MKTMIEHEMGKAESLNGNWDGLRGIQLHT
jgi:hypothetical protein